MKKHRLMGLVLSAALFSIFLPMALMLLGVLLVVIFGVWGTNYDAQAFIYFQF